MGASVIDHKSYARVGLLGNPSDVYYGKTLSFSIGNFWACVRLEPSQNLVIVPHPTHDLVQFNSITHLVNRLQSEGYYGGVRLLMAICKNFHNYCKDNNITLREGNFTLSYDTNIPRQTGLSGSSAIVTAALNCLLDFYEVRHVIKVEVRPNLVLNAEKELGIVAGLQDRVAQVYGGLVYMDFGKNHMDEFDHGIYTPMDIGLLPSLYLIYAENPSDSGKVHSTVRQRWLAGDEFIISTMEEIANLAVEGQKALLVKDYAKLATLMNHNFDLRRRMFGDDALGAVNIEMVEVARKVGAASKFTGSGGAVVVFCPDGPSQVKQLKDACQQAGFIFRPIEVMPSYLKDVDLKTLTSNQMRKAPPVAKKVRHEMELFGDVRVDNYYWLRDDSRSNPEVLSYLQEENAYTDSVMSGTKQLEDCIYSEIRGRVKEDDISAPMRKGPYYYYTRNLAGKEYVQHCRRYVPNATAPTSVYDTMPTGSDAPPEHIILDENVKALEHTYYKIDAFRVSPNNKLVAYAEDTKGDEIYTVYVIDAESGVLVGKPLVGVITSDLEWAGDEALVYITMDHEILRPDKVWLHKLGTDQSDDICLYHEKDEKFSLFLEASESKKYLFVASKSKITRSVFYLDTSNPENGLVVLTPRLIGIDTSASHRGNHFFIKRRSDECFNSELLVCPVEDTSASTLLLPHRPSVKLQNIQLFTDHLAVHERENGLPRIIVYRLPAIGEPLERLQGGRAVDFVDPVYSVDPVKSQFESNVLRFSYTSLRNPPSVYDYDMDTGVSVLKKIETVLGGFDASNYVTERKWATAADGIQIPISLVYQNDLVKLDGSDPLLLYGYGSYEVCKNPTFNASWLSLIDRGFICALAHIRGGGEMGRQWYENGKLLKKKNTFTDFIACAEYLIENKYCSKERLCIHGRSAGGLLIGAVLNMRPDLFKAAVAGVPFVDVVTTMLDSTIPLTTSEWEEWGDPRKEEFYFYMKSYSPVDNVKAQNYPHILITTGLNDPRVMYFEPAKFVAKLRDMKTDDNLLLFKCEMGAGHFSKSGRFQKLQEEAFTYTFILKALNML